MGRASSPGQQPTISSGRWPSSSELIRERTRAGLAVARACGRQGGRPKKLASERQIKMTQSLYNKDTHSINDICQMLGVSRATLYRAVKPLRSTNG